MNMIRYSQETEMFLADVIINMYIQMLVFPYWGNSNF